MTIAVEDRTWDSAASAARWFKRNPQEGHAVTFDNARSVFCVRPKNQIEGEIEELADTEPTPAPKAPRKAVAPAKKAAKAGKPAKAAKGKAVAKAGKDGPAGKTADIIKLALRKNGVSPTELFEATQWHGAPWKWLFHNPKGKGLAQKHGYDFRAEKANGETRYFLTRRAA